MEGLQTFNCMGSNLSEEERAPFYQQMKNVVVIVDVFNEQAEEYDWEGAGVLISEEGHVLTLSHMLSDNSNARVRVLTKEGKTPYDTEIISLDNTMGLAILKVSQSNFRFPYASICEHVSIGEEFYPIGHPGYLAFSYPIGHVSNTCRDYDELRESLDAEALTHDLLKERQNTNLDPSASSVCFVDELDYFHNLCGSVSFIQVNNVHGDGMGGASGMPLFNCRGGIVGLYFFLAYDQCFGIHAKTLDVFVKSNLSKDKSGKKKKKSNAAR